MDHGRHICRLRLENIMAQKRWKDSRTWIHIASENEYYII